VLVLHAETVVSGNVGSPITPLVHPRVMRLLLPDFTISLLIADPVSKDGIVRVKARQQLEVYGIILILKLACHGNSISKQLICMIVVAVYLSECV
jgi:hypothetical protein